jgi:mannosyltransferase OCH1-like enzyme
VLQQSWRKYHPDWTYILWTDKEIAEFGLVNKKLFDSARNWGQKSDIARYEILCRMGGLYIDTDFECLKSFDILHDSLDFYTCCIPAKDGGVEIINALIAACPGHPILKACVNGLHNVTASTNIWHIIETTGPYFFTKAVFAFLTGRSVIFPVTYFYPMPAWIASQKPNHADVIQRFVKDESFALHWWDCSWQRLRLFKKGLDNEKF